MYEFDEKKINNLFKTINDNIVNDKTDLAFLENYFLNNLFILNIVYILSQLKNVNQKMKKN